MCMNSSLWGSGVTPAIEIVDSDGSTVLATEEGDPDASPNATIENVSLAAGSYYARVVGPKDATGGPDHWWRFILYVASFEVSSYESGGYTCP